MSVYSNVDPIRFEGPDSRNPLVFRWYDAKRVVLGKTLAECLSPPCATGTASVGAVKTRSRWVCLCSIDPGSRATP